MSSRASTHPSFGQIYIWLKFANHIVTIQSNQKLQSPCRATDNLKGYHILHTCTHIQVSFSNPCKNKVSFRNEPYTNQPN